MKSFGKSLALVLLSQQTVFAMYGLRFASPLQTLTIPDKEVQPTLSSKRSIALKRFRAGLQAEADTRKKIAAGRSVDSSRSEQRQRREMEEKLAEEAFEEAANAAELSANKISTSKSSNKYQFVGVINKNSADKPITWYARKKPAGAQWSVRLVHVNKDAIIKDLHTRGKIDIFAKYRTTGEVEEESRRAVVTSKYDVRERSWKNLWNFSPKHFFSDPSGMYWRERRLRPGLYTDGAIVYESSYRYGDGRNGMRRTSTFEQFLASKYVSQSQKDKIVKRLKTDTPDVVLEQ